MIGVVLGVVAGVAILVIGTKQGWLLEKPKEPEKNLKEKLEEDGEIYDPYKKIDEKIKDKLRTDEKFRSEFHEFAQSKKAKVMENMSESERKDFEKYIQEMKMEAERQAQLEKEGIYHNHNGFFFESCIFLGLILFCWWAAARHFGWINPMDVAEDVMKDFISLFNTMPGKDVPYKSAKAEAAQDL